MDWALSHLMQNRLRHGDCSKLNPMSLVPSVSGNLNLDFPRPDHCAALALFLSIIVLYVEDKDTDTFKLVINSASLSSNCFSSKGSSRVRIEVHQSCTQNLMLTSTPSKRQCWSASGFVIAIGVELMPPRAQTTLFSSVGFASKNVYRITT